MSVENNLPIVRERKLAIQSGDPERVAEQKKLGKLTARERIGLLFDAASFVELDALVGRDGESGVVTGYGLIDGRPAYVYAQDYTVKYGAVGAEYARKVLKVMDLAAKTGAPIVALMDSLGVRLSEGADAINTYARISGKTAQLSGVVPQIAVVLGRCAASSAMVAVMNDLVVMGENGRMFMNGPQVVSANTKDRVDAKTFGDAQACLKNGLADLVCASDEDAIARTRQLVCMLPANNLEDAPVELTQRDDVNRLIPEFDQIDTVADIRKVISCVADGGQALELGADWAPEMVTALAAIGGRTVGFVATQPGVDEGLMTTEGCKKAARFVRMLDCFNVPVVTLCDSNGINAACAFGQGALARACGQLNAALADASVGRIALVTGNAVGTAYMALASHAVADVVYAWPGSYIAPMNVHATVEVLAGDKLANNSRAQEKRQEMEADYRDNVADAVSAAKLGHVDDVIEPSQTRQMLAMALEMLSSKREARLPKKHGNLPL